MAHLTLRKCWSYSLGITLIVIIAASNACDPDDQGFEKEHHPQQDQQQQHAAHRKQALGQVERQPHRHLALHVLLGDGLQPTEPGLRPSNGDSHLLGFQAVFLSFAAIHLFIGATTAGCR